MSTQKDVAKEAGVSIASVSRYVNHASSVKPDTSHRIQSAIDKLGYRPNLVARSLKLRSTNTVALIFADIKDPFFSYIANKAEQVAHDHGFSVILCNTQYDAEREMQYLELLKNRNVDGYLILTTMVEKSALYTLLKNENVVFVDQSSGFQNEVFVKLDNREGMRLGIEHLVKKGHRNIGVINFALTSTTGIERLEGYKQALEQYGIPYNPQYVKFCQSPDWMETCCQKTGELLRMKQRPTALFPMNGNTTIGALHTIRQYGLKIPDDISVIGFDELFFSELLSPALTTIAQPVEKFGETGMELLIEMIREKLPRKRNIIELQPQLIERDSCQNIQS